MGILIHDKHEYLSEAGIQSPGPMTFIPISITALRAVILSQVTELILGTGARDERSVIGQLHRVHRLYTMVTTAQATPGVLWEEMDASLIGWPKWPA